jgi:preprotein translocase subunit YajC
VGYVIVLVALFALMWLLLIRPQRRRALEQTRMQESLQVDDEILTAGGIHGTVKAIEDEVLHVEIAPEVTVRLDRRAVGAVLEESELEEETGDTPQPIPPGES